MLQKVVRQKPVTEQIFSILIDRIDSGYYQSDFRLPSENQLALEFETSRATIRRVMDLLESNGEIHRKQGIGAFIQRPTSITRSLDRAYLLQKLIQDHGFTPGIIFLEANLISPDKKLCEALKLPSDEKMLQLKKIFLANEKPVIYLLNSFPVTLFSKKILKNILSDPSISEPIFDFLLVNCNQKLRYYLSSIRVDIMNNCPLRPPDSYSFDPNEVALVTDEVAFSDLDKPIMHALFYYPGNIIKFNLIRKVINLS